MAGNIQAMRDALTMANRREFIHVIIGRRGSGKSTTASWIVEAWQATRIAALQAGKPDPLGDVLAIDPVAKTPPHPSDVSFHATAMTVVVPETLPPEIRLLAVDEADMFIGQRADRRSDVLEDIVRRGRHRGVSIILASQRPALMLYDVWTLADRVSICHMTGKRDLARVAELDGVEEHLDIISARSGPGVRVVWDAVDGVSVVGGGR